jgi:hypothetical protein
MDMSDFIAGNALAQHPGTAYQYKSFVPESICHSAREYLPEKWGR